MAKYQTYLENKYSQQINALDQYLSNQHGYKTNLNSQPDSQTNSHSVAEWQQQLQKLDAWGKLTVAGLAEGERTYRELFNQLIPQIGKSKATDKAVQEYGKILNAAHLRKQMQSYELQSMEWERRITRVATAQQDFMERMAAAKLRGQFEWEKSISEYKEEWRNWEISTLRTIEDGQNSFTSRDERIQNDRSAWEERTIALSFKASFEKNTQEIKDQITKGLDQIKVDFFESNKEAWLFSFVGQKRLAQLESDMRDNLAKVDKKYTQRLPRMRDYFALGKMTLQPTSDDQLNQLEQFNTKIQKDNQELQKFRVFEMMQQLYQTQTDFLADYVEDRNLEQDAEIADKYMFISIRDQAEIMKNRFGMSQDANYRKLNRIEDILFNHGLDGRFYVSGRNDTSVKYDRVLIGDVSLLNEELDTHGLTAFNYFTTQLFLPNPLEDFAEVKQMDDLGVKRWQALYQSELQTTFQDNMQTLHAYLGEDKSRFYNEYANLFMEYMGGASKADVPFYKKKIFMEGPSWLSMSSAFDGLLAIGSAALSIATLGAALPGLALAVGGIQAGKTAMEAVTDKVYYQEDMSWGDMFQKIGMAGLSFGVAQIPGFGSIMNKGIGANVLTSLVKTAVNQVGGSLLTCATSQGKTCHLDISDSLQGLAVSGITTGVSGGVGELNIETKTSSQFVNTLTGVAANKLTTLAVNSAGDALHERKIDPYTAMGGVGLQDVTGLLGALGQDVHAGVKSQHLIDNGWDSRNAIMHTKLKVRSAYLQRELIQAKKDRDTDKIETLKQQMAQYNREMNVIENNEGVPTTPIPAILLPAILPRKREEVINGEVLETDPKETDDEVTPPDASGEVEQEEELIDGEQKEVQPNEKSSKLRKGFYNAAGQWVSEEGETSITGTGEGRGEISSKGELWLAHDLEGKKLNKNGEHIVYPDSASYPTQGYGVLKAKRKMRAGDELEFPPQTEAEAFAEYKLKLKSFVKTVNNRIKNRGLTVNQSQFDALVALEYNYGDGTKNVQNAIKNGVSGAKLKNLWTKQFNVPASKSPGLPKRRLAEYILYSTGKYTNPYK